MAITLSKLLTDFQNPFKFLNFDRKHERDRQQDGQTPHDGIGRRAYAWHAWQKVNLPAYMHSQLNENVSRRLFKHPTTCLACEAAGEEVRTSGPWKGYFYLHVINMMMTTRHRLHYIGFIAASFQKETENSLISAILSGHYFVVCYGFLSPSWSL